MKQEDFIRAVSEAVDAKNRAGNKWDALERLFSRFGMRGNGALNNGSGADRTTRARQLATTKQHAGHNSRDVATHSVFVIAGQSLSKYDEDPADYVDKVRDSVLQEHPTCDSCLIMVCRRGSQPEPVRLLKRIATNTPMGYEEWWPGLPVENLRGAALTERPSSASGGAGSFSDELLAEDAFVPLEELKQLVHLLLTRRNVILQGPPGVGKSFLAKRLAYSAVGSRDATRVLSLQFHPSYSYEEFVEGFRPKDGSPGFEVVDGNLRGFVEDVVLNLRPEEPCVLILDELNRANVSAVLGEVMSLIEPDKRGAANCVQMLYSREPFFLPENLLILGLMNTADRSIALVDYALRRRFAFVDLPPRFNSELQAYLDRKGIPSEATSQLFAAVKKVNDVIRASTTLGRGFEIGHSYFCNCPDLSHVSESYRVATATAWITEIIRHDIAPLLREYWFDDRDTRLEMIVALLGRQLTDDELRAMVD
jgi:MoxR-like ATPase